MMSSISASAAPEFKSFIESLWPQAKARGVSRSTFDAALQGVTPDPKVVALTKKQAEFNQHIWDYLGNSISNGRIAEGRAMAERYASTLDAIEARYGVPRAAVLGIWGMETNFGRFTGGMPVIRSLATLAHVRYRGTFFRDELLNALTILEEDHITPQEMRGSWAGAMGQTQFMPSSFLKYAVDFDGNGKRDIWTSIPDALASTANYLREHGWQPGLPWGFEVALPSNFDFRGERTASLGAWAQAGVTRADEGAMQRSGQATLFLPGGAKGPAFLVTANYDAIKAYNSSDAYALAVGHLGDRIYGGAPIQGDWPEHEPKLSKAQRIELQKRLNGLGYTVGEPDGKFGSRTREAVRRFQMAKGLTPDGFASLSVLQKLRTVH